MAKVIGNTGGLLVISVDRTELYEMAGGGTRKANDMLRLQPGDKVNLITKVVTKSVLNTDGGADWAGAGPV